MPQLDGLERFWSPEPVRAIKHAQKFKVSGSTVYKPIGMGMGIFALGEWYDAKHGGNPCSFRCWTVPVGIPCGFYAWKNAESVRVSFYPTHECRFEFDYEEPDEGQRYYCKDQYPSPSREYFNSLRHDARVLVQHNTNEQYTYVWVEVELGTCIDHTYGYRAKSQRIVRELEDMEVEAIRDCLNRQLKERIPEKLGVFGWGEERLVSPWQV